MLSPPVLFVDCRCLQESALKWRAVQSHSEVLLRSRQYSSLRSVGSVALIDQSLGALPPQIAELFDCVTADPNPAAANGNAVFIDLSPLTHDPFFPGRFSFRTRAAVVYDFVGLQWRWHSNSVADRIRYCSQLFALKQASLFFPVSAWTAQCLASLAGVPEEAINVTAIGIPSSFFEARERYLQSARGVASDGPPFFLLAGSSDSRGNEIAAIRAVRTFNGRQRQAYEIAVIGQHDNAYKRELLEAASPDIRITFHSDPPLDDLVRLYSSAAAAICPAHLEGFCRFSVEAFICGTPVIGSACAAHAEFFPCLDTLFPSTDPDALTALLMRVTEDAKWHSGIVTAQRSIAARFHEALIGDRFWTSLSRHLSAGRRPLNYA